MEPEPFTNFGSAHVIVVWDKGQKDLQGLLHGMIFSEWGHAQEGELFYGREEAGTRSYHPLHKTVYTLFA